jgi:23S rRNA maturation mini-RNase III
MKNQILKVIAFNLLAIFFAATVSINAQIRNNPNRVSNSTIQALVTRIQTKTDVFKRSLTRSLNRNAQSNTANQDTVFGYITDFENEIAQMKQNSGTLRTARADVEDLLSRAVSIDDFIRENRMNQGVQRDWTSLKADLDTLAGYYNVSSNWNQSTNVETTGNMSSGNINSGTTSSYRVPEGNVRTLLTRLQTRTDSYKRELNTVLDRGILNQTRSQTTIYSYVTDFQTATDRLKQNLDARRSTSADIDEVLSRAYYIDSFMRDYRFTTGAESQWRLIRTDLDTLANYYNVTWNWNRQYSPMSKFDQMLTGTYRLNTSQSDDVRAIVDRAATSFYTVNQRDNLRRNLERRLTSPETLVIEKRDSQVTIASNNAPQVIFNADGTARTEATGNGRTIKVTATTNYDGVALNYEGDRMNDFYVNFTPMSNGQLRVIRRVYLENRNDTVTVASVYDKTDNVAQFSGVGNQNTGYNQNTGATSTDFVIPNNTRLTAMLRSAVSTKTSQDGDRFTMEVTSPSEFNGATIEGRVARTQRSGAVTGRANVSLEFDTIRLRDGRTYRFAGIVDDVTLANGEKVAVNNEGSVRDNNQTTKTVTRAGIGAALGALIGAIAGGGSGAAIGAAVGAGAGAGTVILQGRGDVELSQGTQFTITSSAPANLNSNR